MIDTPILSIVCEKKIFENVETSLYSTGFVIRPVWNTNDDRYSNFGHFYEKKKIIRFWPFLQRHFFIYLSIVTATPLASIMCRMIARREDKRR